MKSILFDFDGTLADTMTCHWEAWLAAVRPALPAITKEEYFLLEGKSLKEIAGHLVPERKNDSSYLEKIIYLKVAYFRNNCSPASLYPHVEEVVDGLFNDGLLLGIVTSSNSAQLEIFEKRYISVFEKMSVIITGEMVKKGKPDPEGYMQASTYLAVAPDDCVVIENSVLGVTAAKNANMRCIGITNTLSRKSLDAADLIIDSFSDVGLALKHLRGR